MKLSVVIPVLNQVPLAKECYKRMVETSSLKKDEIEFIIIDNESTPPLLQEDFPGAIIVRNDKNNGVYPTFKQGFAIAQSNIVAFFHSDVVIYEHNWDQRVYINFEFENKLGMLGFIGSNEIDNAGGRGLGTISNMNGRTIQDDDRHTWTGSGARVHGKGGVGSTEAAVIDGCSMIINRMAWMMIDPEKDIGPHHFYDKMISCQILEAGWRIIVLGIAFDHISGQTANQEPKYQESMKEWCDARNIPMNGSNWDETIYHYSEAKWLKEYRDEKHLIPIRV